MIQPEPLELWKARSSGEVVNATFAFFRTTWGALSRAFFVLVMPAVLVLVAAATYLRYNPDLVADTLGYVGLLGVLEYFPNLLIGTLILTLVNSAIARYAADKPIDKSSLLKDVRRHYFQMLGASSLQLCLLALAVVPLLGMGMLSFELIEFFAFLSMLPGVYVWVCLLGFPTTVLYESCGLIQGLQRSFELTKHYWWHGFGVLLITLIVAFVLALSLSIPALLFRWIDSSITATSGEHTNSPFFIALNIVRDVGYWMVIAIPMAASALQYFNLMERKEGVGVLRRIDAIGREDGPLQEESW